MDEKKGINTTELTLLIIGSTIGSGVFEKGQGNTFF